MKAPCKDCAERTANCHSKCEYYMAFRKEADKLREERMKLVSMGGRSPGLKATIRRNFLKRRK